MAEAAELEAWVREELSVPADSPVAISEKPGSDPRCSPVITEVAIGGGGGGDGDGDGGYSFHIERSLEELTQMDFIAALAFGGGH